MMIDPRVFFDELANHGADFYTGVPDSLLSDFCAFVDENSPKGNHLIAANEGNAIAVAMGYHLATGKTPVVYMQNSGLGNAINPLLSLVDPEVYKVPMLLIVGWRGEPSLKDEPQHVKQGRVTLQILETLEIPFSVLDQSSDFRLVLKMAFDEIDRTGGPFAVVVRKSTFSSYPIRLKNDPQKSLRREEAINEILELSEPSDLLVSTTGKTSRELFELRLRRGEVASDFLTVGGMGHTSSIALGVSIGNPTRRIICLDGDGSLIMHMGSMPVIASIKPRDFIHVIINNESHESVGGQATVAKYIDFELLSKANGYQGYSVAHDIVSLRAAWSKIEKVSGPVLLEIKVAQGSRGNLGRPTTSAEDNKRAFMVNASA